MYKAITDWSEVWALLIPLFFLLFRRNNRPYLKPVRLYVIAALLINVPAIVIQKYKVAWGYEPGDFLYSNNFLYNLHSVVRLLLFSWFFILLNQRFMTTVKKMIPFVFLAFVIINFTVYENFFDANLSSRLLATEAALLLFYCLQYYIFMIVDDGSFPLKKQRGFLVVTGLTFYVAASFFIFLMYDYLVNHDEAFSVNIWDVHNAMYVVLCICIAITLNKKDDR